jgi:heptosyltransferase-2
MVNTLDRKKILIFEVTSGIGDVIMTIPMLKLLHEKMPEADITLIVNSEGTRQLFETCPFIKKIIKIDIAGQHLVRKNLRLLQNIRRDYVFDFCMVTCDTMGYLSMSINSIIAKLIKARRRIGFSFPVDGSAFSKLQLTRLLLNDTITVDFSKHYVTLNVELLKLAEIYPNNEIPAMELWLTEEDVTTADKFLWEHGIQANDMLIGIHPGGKQVKRRWPKENFSVLIEQLQDEYPGAKVIIFGGPDEEELKRDVINLTKTTKPIIVEMMPMRAIAALIKKCNLFIGNDSALTHIATVVETPAVVIFGQANPLATGPYGKKSIVVTGKLDCQPCSYNKARIHTRMTCKRNSSYACLTQLPVSEVFKAVKSLSDSLLQDMKAGK